MSHPLLSRAHLEAVLIGIAVVRHDLAPRIAARVDRDRFSVAAWALLEQLAFPSRDWHGEPGDVRCATKTQMTIADRVDALTIADLCFWNLDTVLALVNQLPERVIAQAAWERDLATAVGDVT